MTPISQPIPPPAVGGDVHFVDLSDYTAGGAGVDVRADFQSAIDAAVTANLPLYVPPGTYEVGRNGANGYAIRVYNQSNFTMFGVPGKSIIKARPITSTTQMAILWLENARNVTIRDLVFDGAWGNATATVASTTGTIALPAATINVQEVGSEFGSTGTFWVLNSLNALQQITYTGKTATSFTGCSGGTGTVFPGATIGTVNSGYGITHTTQAPYSSTIAAGSNGQNINALTATTLHVATTTGASASGTLNLDTASGWKRLTYTGVTATSFTGVTTSDSGVVSTGGAVFQSADPKSHGISVYVDTQRVLIENCMFRQIYGDAIRMGSGLLLDSTRDIRVVKCSTNTCARNGITVSNRCEDVVIDQCDIQNARVSPIDIEPELDGAWVRNVTVQNCKVGCEPSFGFWFAESGSTSENAVAIGGSSGTHPQPNNYIQKIRLLNNKIFGSVSITDAVDIVLDGNTIQQLNATAWAPVFVTTWADDVRIENNWIRAAMTPSSWHQACVSIVRGGANINPTGVTVKGNRLRPRNGNHGVYVEGAGGNLGTTGTATAIQEAFQPPTLTHTGAGWTVNAYVGCQVRVGTLLQTVVSNTSEVLTFGTNSNWTDAIGNEFAAPAAAAYVILGSGGITEIVDNHIDCRNDGLTAGGVGVTIVEPSIPNGRYRVSGNKIRSAATSAIKIACPSTAAAAHRSMEIVGNHAWDDMPTQTTTNVIEFTNVSALNFSYCGRVTMADNTSAPWINPATGAATQLVANSGLTLGTWLRHDGGTQDWTGYGSPETVVTAPVSSTYRRRDGAGGTVLYVKETGTGNTGWVAYSSPTNPVLKWETLWMPAGVGNSTAGVNGITYTGMAPAGTLSVGASAVARGVSTGSHYGNAHKIGFDSSSTASRATGQRVGAGANLLRGVSTGGGFTLKIRFGIADAVLVGTANMFVGIMDVTTAATDVQPETLTNIIGVGCTNGDTAMQLYAAGAVAQARTSLGAGFPVNTVSTDVYEFQLYCAPCDTQYAWTLTRWNSAGASTSTNGTITAAAQLPGASTAMTPHFWRSNGGTAAAVGIDLFSLYCVVDH